MCPMLRSNIMSDQFIKASSSGVDSVFVVFLQLGSGLVESFASASLPFLAWRSRGRQEAYAVISSRMHQYEFNRQAQSSFISLYQLQYSNCVPAKSELGRDNC